MSKALAIIAPRTSGRPATAVVVQRGVKRRRSAEGRRRPKGSSGASSTLSAYSNTLNDPFEYPSIPLGYDCYLPTSMATAYLRSSLPVNSDGSFSLWMNPDVQNMVRAYSLNGSTTIPGVTFAPAANAVGLQTTFKEGRVVSGGIRCFALFPETSAPGVLFAGSAPDLSRNDTNLTVDTISALPGSRLGIGSKGSHVTMKPYDNASYEFFTQNISGHALTAIPYMTSLYIAGKSFPVGTVIWYEAVLNIEAIAATSANALAPPSDDVAPPTGASTYFPTPGTLFNAVQKLLSPSVIMDSIDVAASYAMGGSRGAAASLGRIARQRMTLGTGRSFNNAYGNFAHRQSKESTVMIEEMKEDAGPSSAKGRWVQL